MTATKTRWIAPAGAALVLWGGFSIATTGGPALAWLVALLGIALLAVGLLRR